MATFLPVNISIGIALYQGFKRNENKSGTKLDQNMPIIDIINIKISDFILLNDISF